MLILTRRVGETIHIGDDIVVKVNGVRGNQVSIAISAPPNTPVHRSEVYNRIKKEGGAGVNHSLPLHNGRDQ